MAGGGEGGLEAGGEGGGGGSGLDCEYDGDGVPNSTLTKLLLVV